MQDLEETSIHCPFCGESIQILVDCSIAQQTYTEDCFVCCHPIVLQIHIYDGDVQISCAQEEDGF